MVDISPVGAGIPQPSNLNTAARPLERVESERRAAVDSDIERQDAERAENRAQDQAALNQAIDDRRDRRADAADSRGERVDILV